MDGRWCDGMNQHAVVLLPLLRSRNANQWNGNSLTSQQDRNASLGARALLSWISYRYYLRNTRPLTNIQPFIVQGTYISRYQAR